jgi:transcriptional regulator with XRE-family HTH domain
MELLAVGRLIREHRRNKGLTLTDLAARARVGRSTLAALEGGKLGELGYAKVARICAAVDLVLEARPPALAAPLVDHRHLTELGGRTLTKAAIDDIITRGEVASWRGLIRAVRADETGALARRVREVVAATSKHDPKARSFALLLPRLLGGRGGAA